MSDNSYTETTSSTIPGAENIPKVETNMPEDTSLKARLAEASRPPVDYNIDAGVQFKSVAGITDKTVTGRDANKYIGYANYLEDLNTRDAQAARSQSAGQKVAYGLYQGIVGEVIGGSLQGLGSLAMGASSEENALFSLGKAISEKTQESSHIFAQEPGKAFALNDVGWWASNIPSLLSTLSMFVPGMAVGKAASAVGRAGMVARRARDVAKLKKTASSAEVAQRAIRATAGKAAQASTQVEKGASTVLTAVGMRHAENIREAVDVAKQAENEFLQSQTDTFEMMGTTAFRQFVADNGRQPTSKYELAKYVGAAAAKTSYRVNSSNIVFDLTQTAMIFKPFKAATRGATSTGLEATKAAAKLGKKASKEITDAAKASTRVSRFLDKLAPFKEFGIGMATEGVEEAVNFIGSAEGLAYAEELRGIDRGSFGERLEGYLADDHLWEGAFWGALGGGVFQAVGGAFGKKQNALLRAHEEQIKTQEYYAGEIKKAEESGDGKKAEQLKSQMITTLALKAAQSGRVDSLINMLNDESYLDELSKSGMGTLDELLAKKDSLISQVEQVEARYKEAIEWATSNGMDSFSKGAYLNDSLRAHSIIAQADTMLEKLEATKELGSEEEILAARLMLLDEIKDLSEEERAFYAPTILEIMDEKAAFEKQKGRPVLPAITESLESGLNNDLRTRVTLEATRAASERQISKMRSQDAVADYMDRGEKMQKEEAAKFEKRVKEEIKKETNETRLNDMLKTAKRTKNEEIQNLVESRLKELAEQKEARAAADNPEETAKNKAKEDERKADRADDSDAENPDNQLSFEFDENTTDEATPVDEVTPEADIAEIESRRKAELEVEQLPVDRVKRRNGAIGTQGVTTDQVKGILENVLGLKVKDGATMRELVDLFLSDSSNVTRLREFTEKNPIEITILPDGTVQINDGHHRAFLLDQAGITELPVTQKKGRQINAKYDAEVEKAKAAAGPSDKNNTENLNLDQPTSLEKIEELAPLIERILAENKASRDEAEASQEAAIAEYDNRIAIRSKDIKRITAKKNRLKKKDDPISQSKVAAYETIIEYMKAERTRLREQKKQVKDLVLPRDQELQPGRDLDPDVAEGMQASLDEAGGAPIFITELLSAFVKNMTYKAPSIFENGKVEWRLDGDKSEVVLDETQSIVYAAVQSLLNGANARIQKVDRADFKENNVGVVEINVKGNVKDITAFEISKGRESTRIEIDSEGYPIVHYAIIVEHKGQDVIVGYLPQVGTLAKHAQSTNIYMVGGPYPPNAMDLAYMAMHSNSFTAISAIDRLIRLRKQLADNNDQPLPFKLHTGSQFGGKPQRGSLVRPGVGSTLKLGELDGVPAAIEEYGFAYMGADKNTNVLRSLNQNLVLPGEQPYQDGLVLNKPGEMDYGKGSLYMPVPVPNSLTKEIIWVRVPKISVAQSGNLEDLQQILYSENLKRKDLIERLRELVPVQDFSEPLTPERVRDMQGGNAPITSGILVDGNGVMYIIEDSTIVGSVANSKASLGFEQKSKEVLSNMTSSFSARTPEARARFQANIPKLLETIKSPIAPVRSANGEVLGYFHTVAAAPQKNSKLIHPDTRHTALHLEVSQEVTEKLEEEQKKKADKKANEEKKKKPGSSGGVRRRKGGRSVFLTSERAQASFLSERATDVDQKEAEAWFKQNLPHVPFRRVKGLIQRGGISAYGVWEDGMVKVSDIGVVGTEYHEAFHAVMDMYLTPSRKAKILAEAKAKYGNLSELELEEKLAESFREYVLTEGKTLSEKSSISRFFSELAALVKAMFTGEYNTRLVMQQINKGKFAKKADTRTQEYMTKFMETPPFDALELRELREVMPAVLQETLDAVGEFTSRKLTSPDKTNHTIKNELKTEFFKSDEVGDAYLDLIVKIGTNILAREAQQSQPEGFDNDSPSETVSKAEIATDLIEAALIDDPYGGIETLFSDMADVADAEHLEKLDADIERIRESRASLIKTFSKDEFLIDNLIGALETDVVVGATDNEQYGKKSMAQVNPKEKIPSAVRNLIGRTPAAPTILDTSIHALIEKGDTARIRKEVLTQGGRNTYDQFSRFGFPRVLNFNHVYPYLLHHLHDSTSYKDMISKMEKLAIKGNPDMFMLLQKLEDPNTPQLIKNQFFIAFKRQSSSEINVSSTQKSAVVGGRAIVEVIENVEIKGASAPEINLGTQNVSLVRATYKSKTEKQRETILKELKRLSELKSPITTADKEALIKAIESTGFQTFTPNAVSVAVLRANDINLRMMAAQASSMFAVHEKVLSEERRGLPFATTKTFAQLIAPADYGAVSVGFKNGVGTSVYSYQLPNFLSEEIDRLKDRNYLEEIIQGDGLADSTWARLLRSDLREKPMMLKFGHYKGKAYTELNESEFLAYSYEIFFEKGYVPIPTPSDATNSALVQTDFHYLSEAFRAERLKAIIAKDKLDTTVDKLREQFKAEAQELLRRNPKLKTLVKNKLKAEAKTTDSVTDSNIVDKVAVLVEGTFDSHWNTSNWIGADIGAYGGDVIKFQKRAKQILSPGSPSVLTDLNDKFNSVTFAEPIIALEKYGDNNVQRADAQSFVTLEHYKKILSANGKLTPAMDAVIDKAIAKEPLSRGERALLRPYKPFYYGKVKLNDGKRVSVQIKNSVVPLVPQFLDNHPQLKAMHDWMQANEIDQVQPPSAQKIGQVENQVVLWNEDGTFNKDAKYDPTQHQQALPMRHYRQQVQINEHMGAADTIGWGTQVSKIITGGLALNEKFKPVLDKLTAAEERLMQLQSQELFKQLTDKDFNVDHRKLRTYIKNNAGSSVSDALKDLLNDTTKSLNNPVHKVSIAQTVMAALQKDFYKLQVPGGMQVQITDLGVTNKNLKVDERLQGMRVVEEDGKKTVLPGQVITSRNFLPKKYRSMSIEEIRAEDPEALKLIVYRVPSEGKNSMAVVEVVGFLADQQDGMIVPAEFVPQMGSDFDVDKLHINWKSKGNKEFDQVWNEYFDLTESVLRDPDIFESQVQQSQGFKDFSATATRLKGSSPARQLKDSTLSKDGTTVDSYAKDNPYSLLTHTIFHQDNAAGTSLKGIAAKANTFWLNVDRFQLAFSFENPVGSITGLRPSVLSEGGTYSEGRLSRTAQSVAASMDGAKDPVYGYLGINQSNFTFFHDLYMLGLDFEKAIKIASNVHVKAELEFTGEVKGEKSAEDQEALSYLEAYKDEWKGKLDSLRKLLRSPDTKLIDMASTINPIDDSYRHVNQSTIDFLKEVKHNQTSKDGDPMFVFDLPAIQGYLNQGKNARMIMSALGVEYYTELTDVGDLKLQEYGRYQNFEAAQKYLGSNLGNYRRMGKINVSGPALGSLSTRPDRVSGEFHDWNMEDFLIHFGTEEGKAQLQEDLNLSNVVKHLLLGNDYIVKDDKGVEVRLVNVRPLNLTDAEVAADFRNAWNNLFTSKLPIAKGLSEALVEYEAERSAWRFGQDTFTAHLPATVVNGITSGFDPQGNNARLLRAFDPNLPKANNKKHAASSQKPMLFLDDRGKAFAYITQYVPNPKTGMVGPVRSKVAIPKAGPGLNPLVSFDKLQSDWNLNVTQVKDEKAGKNFRAQSRKTTGSETSYESRKSELEGRFAAAGVKVKVVKDSSIETAGDVEFDGETGIIRVHPDRMGGDTLIHEFAHIYVELLGYSNELVQQAINELKGTDLYREIEELYPDLTRRELDMEVLVTAMGRKGDLIFNQVKNQSKLRTLINKIVRAIGKFLGIPQDTAKLLAESMIRGEGIAANMDTREFKAQQRLSNRLNEQQLQEEVSRELTERIAEMRQLGMTSNQEVQILDSLVESRTNLNRVDVKSNRNEIIDVSIDNIESTLEQSLAFINNSFQYLNDSAMVSEFRQADTEFFNTVRQLKMLLSTYEQAVESFVETGPNDRLIEFRGLQDRIPSLLKQLRNLEREAISNKLKSNSVNKDITEIELNLFDLAQHAELSSYMRDSGSLTSQLQGLGEQDAVVLQLLHKQINRVVEGYNLDAKNDKDVLDEIMDEAKDIPVENLLDKTGQAFISPLKDNYWQSKSLAIAQGVDSRLWEARNHHMPYVTEYYEWKYQSETLEEKDLRQRLQILDEISKKKGLTEEEQGQRADYLRALADIQANSSKSFFTYHKQDIDQAQYDADRAEAKAKGEEALKRFDKNNLAIVITGAGKFNRRPQKGSKYFKGYVVKDEYKNPKWLETDVEGPLDKWSNDKYNQLTELEKKTITRLQALMAKRLPKDSAFMQENLIPQIGEVKSKSIKDHIKDGLKVDGVQQKQRLDANGRIVPIPPFMSILRRNKKDSPVNTNLKETISEFIDQTSSAHARNTLASFMLANRDQLADANLVTPGKGLNIAGFGKKKAESSPLTKGERSRAIDVLEHVLEGYLGSGWTDKSKNDNLVKKFLTYNSFMGIGLNPSAWINNVTYGGLQQRLETLGGAQWEKDQMKKARGIVRRSVLDIVKSRKKGSTPNTANVALLNWFDVTMDQRELPDSVDSLSRMMDASYFGQTYGELYMQSQVALAMMMNTKIILADGTETNMYDALINQWDGKKGIVLPKGARLVRADGTLVPLTLQEVGAQKSKFRSVLQRIHGAYNSEDMGMWHRKAVGQVFMQFRKWIPQSIKRRFGRDTFSEIREEREIGYYKALFQEIVMGGLRKDGKYLRFLSSYKAQPPHIQKAALKGLYELMGAAFIGGASAILASLVEVDDDDDDFLLFNENFYKAKLLYHTDRLYLEMAQYTPFGIYDFFKKAGKDPAAGYRTATNFFNILNEVAYSAIHWEMREFKGGRHYGEAKLPIYVTKASPVYKQYSRGRDTIDTVVAYSLNSSL